MADNPEEIHAQIEARLRSLLACEQQGDVEGWFGMIDPDVRSERRAD